MDEYEKILNDPLCKITDVETVNEKNKVFNDEGKLEEMQEFIVYLVHYEESTL